MAKGATMILGATLSPLDQYLIFKNTIMLRFIFFKI
jgi:hypothetical protein